MEQLSNRYGVALFELAKEENVVDVWQSQVKQISSLLSKNNELLDFLEHVLILGKDKKEVVEKVFGKSIDKNILNFMFLLIDNKRVYILMDTFKKFNSLCNEAKNIEEGIVYSKRPLSDEEVTDVEKAMGKKFDKKIELSNKVDLNLLSGVKVVINNTVIDGSMRNKLDVLKENLQNESRWER